MAEEPWWETQAKPRWGEDRPQRSFQTSMMVVPSGFHRNTAGNLVRVRKKTPEEIQAALDAQAAKEKQAEEKQAVLNSMDPAARARRLKIRANTWGDIATGCFMVALIMLLAPAIFFCWWWWVQAQVGCRARDWLPVSMTRCEFADANRGVDQPSGRFQGVGFRRISNSS